MQFQCSLDKITLKQLTLIVAIDSIYRLQSHDAIISSIDKDAVHFTMKTNLSGAQQQRLFVDRVPLYAPGYVGEIYIKDHKKYMKVSRVNEQD